MEKHKRRAHKNGKYEMRRIATVHDAEAPWANVDADMYDCLLCGDGPYDRPHQLESHMKEHSFAQLAVIGCVQYFKTPEEHAQFIEKFQA